ncbi:MAG TPA: carboxypeptidase-like regulatory domain-containing protein [Bryobacteraceae bacterium]|nr:carboxypeptidase-like regulatory domain-containing protein [Bryobacteraceae bacterium]
MMTRWICCLAVFTLLAFACHAQSAAPQAAYRAEAVASGGTITGTVKWSGAAEKDLSRPITKNADVCDPNNQKNRELERLVIGPDGGVANTVVFLSNVTHGKAMDLPPARQSLDQKNCRYEPHILLVPKDGNFQMKSSDTVLHNIHMVGAAVYNLPFPIKDKVISRPMHRDGVIDLKCDAGHVWMNAEVLVVTHPYYAITDAHGNFELANVPPGEYVVTAWHEGWKIAREETVIDVDSHQEVRRPIFSEPKTWDEKVTLPPNGTAKVSFTLSDK